MDIFDHCPDLPNGPTVDDVTLIVQETLGSSAAILTIVMDVKTMTQSVLHNSNFEKKVTNNSNFEKIVYFVSIYFSKLLV